MKGIVLAVGCAVSVVTALLTFTGCDGGRRVVLQPGDDGRVVGVSVGDRVEIRLPGTPSTGYTWRRVEPDDGDFSACPIQVIREGEWTTADPAPGAAGTCAFRYLAVRSGVAAVRLEYIRPWEPTEKAGTYSVVLWVRE